MAISWSAVHFVNGNGMQVGVDVSVSAVTQSSSTVTFTYDVYTRNTYQYNDLQWITYGGNTSGTLNYNNTQAGNIVTYRGSRQYTYTYPPGSFNTSPGTTTFTATVGGAYNGSTPTVSVTTTIPPRPGSPVTPPTNVTLTRVTDQTWTVTWTPQGTPAAPYTSQSVYMQTLVREGGSWVWRPGPTTNHYSLLATVGPAVSSYSQSNAGPNLVYRAAVAANGQFSSSPLTIGNYMYMTPAAPGSLGVERDQGGGQVTLTWVSDHYGGVGATYRIEYRLDGGPWTVEQASLPEQLVSYIAVLPGTGTVEYRIRVDAPDGSVSSPWVYFAPVANAFPPLAPTDLAPNGVARDGAEPIDLTWRHRHAGDGARESAFQVRWSSDGGASWTSTPQLSTPVGVGSGYTLPGGSMPNGATYQWQVRTWGVTSAGPGPWSASATIVASATPVVTLTAPGATITSVPLVAAWTYNQADGSPQARWEARLLGAFGSDPTVPNVIVESRSGVGSDAGVTFAYLIEDGHWYRVEVRAQSAAGLWSAWASRDSLVDLPAPAEPTVNGEYDLCTGTVVLHLDALAPLPGEAPITHVVLERRIGGGPWVALADDLPVPTTFVDALPSTVGANEYRLTAWSAAPSWRTITVTVNGLDGPTPYGGADGLWVFLSYGAGFSRVLRFRGDPDISTGTGRTRKAQHFAGRARPVLLMGDNTTYEVGVSGALFYDDQCGTGGNGDPCRFDSPPKDWEDAGLTAGLVAYRDFHGRRLFGMLSTVDVEHGVIGHGRVSFTVTQVDVTDPWAAAGESVWVDPVPRGAPPPPEPPPPPPAGQFPAVLPMTLA